MWAIQTGSDWWVDSAARFSGGGVGGAFCLGSMNQAPMQPLTVGTPVIETTVDAQINFTSTAIMSTDAGSQQKAGQSTGTHHAEAIQIRKIISKAEHIEQVKSVVRHSGASGVINFRDTDIPMDREIDQPSFSDDDQSDFAGFLASLLQSPQAALAASNLGTHRQELLALLG